MLHRVVPSALPPELAEQISRAASDTHSAMIDANSTWKGLDAYFSVQGAEGVFQMLERLVVDASNFSTAIYEGFSQLIQAEYTLYDLEQRRIRLIDDINDVNTRLSNARSTLSYEQSQVAMVCYPAGSWAERQQEQNVWLAQREVYLAEHEEDKIRKKIERFNSDVEDREGDIARGLAKIRGGTDVHDETGTAISRSKWGWGAPGASTTDLPMVERFERALTNQYLTRLDWMLEQDGSTIDAWMLAHPGFVSAAAMVNPQRISNWFDRLVPRASITENWVPAGAWAVLLNHAPGAIGNLSGIPSQVKHVYNDAYLTDLIATHPNSETVQQLRSLRHQVNQHDGDVQLLTLFLDGDKPRASLAFGNVDEAEQIYVMTHGIKNDLSNIRPWIQTAHEMYDGLLEQNAPSTATVVWFGYDSGNETTVQNNVNARTGAARFDADLSGIRHTNSDTSGSNPHIVAGLHSYGTTMGGEAFIRNPAIFNAVFMNGSPGISDAAANTYSQAGLSGETAVHAALAEDDKTAGFWGGKVWNFDHRNNPVGLEGITVIDVDGADGSHRITGHQAHQSEGEPGYFSPGTASYNAMMEYLSKPMDEK